jgi:hypothetical protein
VRRFGSKRALLLTMSRASGAAVAPRLAALRAAHESPLAALHAWAAESNELARTPAELANHIAFFHNDLVDPDFHAAAVDYFRAERRALRALLADAVAAGELSAGTDVTRLAAAVQVMLNGARVTWAVMREGTLAGWTARQLDTLLGPVNEK